MSGKCCTQFIKSRFFVRIFIMIHKIDHNLIQISYLIILRCFLRGKLIFFMNYSRRLVTKSNMATPNEFIILVNTNWKAAVWQRFGLIKRPRNFKLDENTAMYMSNSVATSGGTTNLRNILGQLHPTTLSKSQMKNRPPTSTTAQFLCWIVRILDYYLFNSYSYSYLFLIVKNKEELTSPYQNFHETSRCVSQYAIPYRDLSRYRFFGDTHPYPLWRLL